MAGANYYSKYYKLIYFEKNLAVSVPISQLNRGVIEYTAEPETDACLQGDHYLWEESLNEKSR